MRSPAYVVTCLRVEKSSVAVSVCCACRLYVHELVRCCSSMGELCVMVFVVYLFMYLCK